MNNIWGMVIAGICLFGSINHLNFPSSKGKCPFKDGVIRKLTDHHGIIVGTEESTVSVVGKDSIVLSAMDGRVVDIIGLLGVSYITIRRDTLVYTYASIDRPLVREGQMVKAGQAIAIARENRIEFFVSNYLGKIYRNPDAYVDCVCELSKPAP